MELKKIHLPFRIKKPILAFGSQTKNSVCFAKDSFAYISATHQNLDDPQDFSGFERAVKHFLEKKPKIIAYDLHPEYQSTKYAAELRPSTFELRAIQHHHAHIASCMLDNGFKNQKVIGVAFDGTGLGSDSHIWGAEFFICDYERFKRRAYLKEIPLLGGEKAILEPARLLAAWLYLIYKDRFLDLDISVVKKIGKAKWRILKKMLVSRFNSPLASSTGRLFDAAASLILGKPEARYEAELAMELESLASSWTKDEGRRTKDARHYRFTLIKDKDCYMINPLPMFKEIIRDLETKEPKERITYRFHFTIASMIRNICLILREEDKIRKIVLSGGVFQNRLLSGLSLDLLNKEGFEVFTHNKLSCNDSGISLGQAAIASFRS